jgi:hypothetical protein
MPGGSCYRRFVILLLFIYCGMPVHAQFFELTGNKKKVEIPFKLVRNLVVIKARVNNRGPYNFILDTGVGNMIITEPKLIDSLNITGKRTLRLAGLGSGND